MPNPLSRITLNPGNVEIGNIGSRSLAFRPILAIAAMECIATWSHVESFMLKLYVDLAGGAEADAAAVYLAMDSASFKATVVRTLAERKLNPDDLVLLTAITTLVKTAQKDRDKIAHWIWGTASGLPDSILLADPRHLDLKREKIFVYTEQDFNEMRLKFERIARFGMRFRDIVRPSFAQSRDKAFDELSREPEISKIMNRPNQQDKPHVTEHP